MNQNDQDIMFNVSLNSDSDSENKVGNLKSFGEKDQSSFASNTGISHDDLKAQSNDETTEKTRLICQILELQNTLEDLSSRVDSVKEENIKLKSENEVLGKYIENLMATSSVFQNTDVKSKTKS